jgi:hypothetical protein
MLGGGSRLEGSGREIGEEMKRSTRIGFSMLAGLALAGLGAGSASATTLEVGGVKQTGSVAITASLKAGSLFYVKDTAGFIQNACETVHLAWSTSSPYSATSVKGTVSTLTFGNCTRPVTVHKKGKLVITSTSGTTGEVGSEEAQVTFSSAIGTLNCTTGSNTYIGYVFGVASGNANLVTFGNVINCGIIPSARLEGDFNITSPGGLGVTG